MNRMLLLIIAVVALSISGCATGRVGDLRDCGRLSVGYGLGLGVEVSLGAIGNPSVGVMSTKAMYGWESRDLVGMWTETETYWPVSSVLAVLMAGMSDGPSGLPYPYFAPYGRHINTGRHGENMRENSRIRNFFFGTGRYDTPAISVFRSATDIEFGATLVFLSARVGINPLEILDYVLGFFGLDIAKDDMKKEEKPDTLPAVL